MDKQATPAAAKQEDKLATAGQASAAQDDEAIAAYSDTTATDTSDYADVDDNETILIIPSTVSATMMILSISSVLYLVAGRCLSSSSSVSSLSAVCLCSADHRVPGYQISDSPPQRPDEVGGDGDGEGHQCSGKRPSD